MSSVNPSESASNNGNSKSKKNRPGKNARNAAKAKSESGTPTPSVTSASFFASQVPSDPVPQPGRYPVVFRTGAGEPTEDVPFCYDGDKVNEIIDPLYERYIWNPRYAEFSDHSGYDDDTFDRDLTRMFLLSLAQQTVHAHVNMGLPLGDFSSIASTDVFVFSSLAAVVRQFGEFQDPSLGCRYLLKDYHTTVKALVRAASQVSVSKDRNREVIRRMWLPAKLGDERTKFIIASVLSRRVLEVTGCFLPVGVLSGYIFNETWDTFENLKALLGGDAADRDRFDFLFSGYTSEALFVQKMSGNAAQRVLGELGIPWHNPSTVHLSFDFAPKVEFPEMVDAWARKRGAVAKFLSITSGVANRSAASGSQAQLSNVSTLARHTTEVRTAVALSAPELSLLACFPPSAIVDRFDPYNVVASTSISLSVRATEFLQLDWVG